MVEDMEVEEELVWLALHLVVVGFLVVASVKLCGGCGDWNFGWLYMKVESCWLLGKANSMFEIDDAAIFFGVEVIELEVNHTEVILKIK